MSNIFSQSTSPAFKRQAIEGTQANRAKVIRVVFEDAYNYMKSGTLMRQVINKLSEIDFNSTADRHTFGNIYEQILRAYKVLVTPVSFIHRVQLPLLLLTEFNQSSKIPFSILPVVQVAFYQMLLSISGTILFIQLQKKKSCSQPFSVLRKKRCLICFVPLI